MELNNIENTEASTVILEEYEDINIEKNTESDVSYEEITQTLSEDNKESSIEVDVSTELYHSTVLNTLDKLNTSVSVIMLVLILFFCNWLLRSWRTWTSKIGRK